MRLKKNAWKRGRKPAYRSAAPAVDLMKQHSVSATVPVKAGYRLFDCPNTVPTFAPAVLSGAGR